MSFPTGPSGTPPRNSGSSGFGSPAPGFGRPNHPGVTNGPSGVFGSTPPLGGHPASSAPQPFSGGAPTPPNPPQPNSYAAPTPPKGTGRFSGAIAALIALLLILAVVLGVGAWFVWGRESSDTGQTGTSSEPTSTAALATMSFTITGA